MAEQGEAKSESEAFFFNFADLKVASELVSEFYERLRKTNSSKN
jgi:hypothetical protein